jgi:hypothetical protein
LCRHAPPSAAPIATDSVARVSTRRLILAALLCGMAILVAFAVQVVIAT